MTLEMMEHSLTRRVSPQSVLDFETFSQMFENSADLRKMNLFERFITANQFIRKGYETYLDPYLTSDNKLSAFRADACGIEGNQITVAFCLDGSPNNQVWNEIKQVNDSVNGRALVLSFEQIDHKDVEKEVPGAIASGKVELETLGWFDDSLEKTLRDTLRTVELLVNETRMRMLTPLLQKSALKREFRARINPKLVYENIEALSKAGLLDEPVEGTFQLSQLGKTVLSEFIVFLERTRRTLGDQKNEEVKQIGRR